MEYLWCSKINSVYEVVIKNIAAAAKFDADSVVLIEADLLTIWWIRRLVHIKKPDDTGGVITVEKQLTNSHQIQQNSFEFLMMGHLSR